MLAPGTELDGRYRIVRLLGEGGMGAVYEAEHLAVGRHVAIKVLHAHFARMPEAMRRFSREARAAAEIGHENIVEVFDAGLTKDEPFLVMELLRGESLRERIARGPALRPDEACVIVGQVLSALASAHAKGIIHRDLKPDNVFLVDQGGDVTVKLLDFGVSKFQRGETDSMHTTQEGMPIGTPAYMAPEQWMGRRDVDHRTDLFAVGVMLYEALTEELPYEGASQGELFLEVVRGSAAPSAPGALNGDVPAGLDAVVLRALRRDRAGRFQSARDFLVALHPYGAHGIDAVDLPAAPAQDDSLASARRDSREPREPRGVPTLMGRPRSTRLALVLSAAACIFAAISAGLRVHWRAVPAHASSVAVHVAPPVAPPAPEPVPVASVPTDIRPASPMPVEPVVEEPALESAPHATVRAARARPRSFVPHRARRPSLHLSHEF